MIVKAETSEAFKSAIMSSNSIEPAAFMSDKKSYATYRKDLLGWSRISKAVPKHRKYNYVENFINMYVQDTIENTTAAKTT